VDLPPVLAGEAYVAPWVSLLDHLLIVVREGATPLPVVRQALEKLDLATPEVVLNRGPALTPSIAPALLTAERRRA
jgi:hypothetical protein